MRGEGGKERRERLDVGGFPEGRLPLLRLQQPLLYVGRELLGEPSSWRGAGSAKVHSRKEGSDVAASFETVSKANQLV